MSAGEIDVENLYRQFGAVVMRRCRALLRDEARAVAATQDTFVKVLQDRGWLAHPAPTALVLRWATFACLQALPRGRDDAFARLAGLPKPSRWERLTMRAGWDDLRLAAVLHLVDGLSLAEAAREAGVCANALRRFIDRLAFGNVAADESEVLVAHAS